MIKIRGSDHSWIYFFDLVFLLQWSQRIFSVEVRCSDSKNFERHSVKEVSRVLPVNSMARVYSILKFIRDLLQWRHVIWWPRVT